MDHLEHTDVVVIGLGPGGEYAAGTLAEAGLHVTGALQVAVRAEVPLATLRNMPYAYPTFYRAIEEALKKLSGVGSS